MIGRTLSHYRITAELGRGGMGVVYLADDTQLQRQVALKLLPPEMTSDPDARERFLQEARAAAALSHPGICTVHECGEHDGRLFIAMEYVEGQDLKARLATGPLPVDEALRIAASMAGALAEAHRRGIVHRDIKPSNVMLSNRGEAKILDFGLARSADQVHLTQSGTTLGTAAYMSPEQARGETIDHRTDLWSLGVVLYQMLCGELPFGGEHEQARIYAVCNQDPVPAAMRRTDLPPALGAVLAHCLKKDPPERYQSAEEMLSELTTCACSDLATAAMDAARPRASRRRVLWLTGVMLLLLTAGPALWSVFAPGEATIDSIAVLPLDNLSGDPGQDWFVDGMTEALIADLARVSALRVISRTSVMRYKETGKSLPEIAGELDVDAVVEGSVLRDGDRIRLTVQLIDAGNDEHLWAESYVRDLKDVLSLQQELARIIAGRIDIQLTPTETDALTDARTIDPAAHDAYLRGRHHFNRRTVADLDRAVEYFQEALAVEPEWAQAYSGLAQVWAVMPTYGNLTPREATALAWEAAERALELDPSSGQARVVLAGRFYLIDFDWEKAEAQYRQALAFSPNSADVHQCYSEFLRGRGRLDEALAEAETALQLDPLSLIVNSVVGMTHYYRRDFDLAEAQFQRIEDLGEHFSVPSHYLFVIRALQGRHDEAVDQIDGVARMLGYDEAIIAAGRVIYANAGWEAFLRSIVATARGHSPTPYFDPIHVATYFALAGDTDEAIAALEEAYAMRSYSLMNLAVDPALDSLRDDPRFDDLLHRLDLDPETNQSISR